MKRCILYAVSFVLMLAFCFSASALTDFSVNDFALWVNTPVADTLNAWQPDGSAGTDPLTVPDIRFCGFSGTLRFVSSDGVLWDTLSWYCDGGIKDTMAVIRDSIESAGAVFLRNEVPDVRGIERVYDIEGHMIRLGFTDEDGAVTYRSVLRSFRSAGCVSVSPARGRAGWICTRTGSGAGFRT